MTDSTRDYLIAGRLQDILALIQVLGPSPAPRRSEKHLTELLKQTPNLSRMDRWSQVAALPLSPFGYPAVRPIPFRS